MTFREHIPAAPATGAFNKTWIVEAAWAHPLWDCYVVFLYDLTTDLPGQQAPTLYKEGMTHELLVFALDPAHPVEPPVHRLEPANHGYQFKAESDEAAESRVVELLEAISAGTLSPDTDFRAMWDSRFVDGVTLLKGGVA
ncbi:hypothetical protein PMI07_000821 [Rhizobium sp. CF080]|uniref:hypothetical protein n=1 Tax=Rhizobium sp. (strain CF080) TaxID=1144310 RepID=UPI000271D61B|nr:hypothetical protein [Rhizobium sp. CF080]EUB97245.1 hypothetical protein PMI07_000821 [Rhizobium sp. CF080]